MSLNNQNVFFNICALSPIYNDITETLRFGISEHGHQVLCIPTIVSSAVNILLDSQTYGNWDIVPKNSIIYNLEQLGSSSLYITDTYIGQLRNHIVWDYSEQNLAWLKYHGINDSAILMPIGYVPTLERVVKNTHQDIDVLFYGWMNERRQHIIRELEKLNLKVVALYKVFGSELDHYIARSKVVVNIHYYETKIFEIIRVSYLLTNRKAVVSEATPETEIDPDLRNAIIGVSYDELADACQKLVHDDDLRHIQEEKAHTIFSARSQVDCMKPALDAFFNSIHPDANVLRVEPDGEDTLANILDAPLNDSDEFSYLYNLDAIELVSEADFLKTTGKNDKVIDLYKFWLNKNQSPLAYAIYFNLGVSLSEENRLKEAIDAFRQSLALKPDFVQSISALRAVQIKYNELGKY